MIPTVLADDHPIIREGLRTLLEVHDGCEVIAETGSGLEAIELVMEKQPALAILDIELPDISGLEVARRIGLQVPGTRVVMLSMYDDEPFVHEALRYGAMGYVLKRSASEDLLKAVHYAMDKRRFLSEPLNDRILDRYATRTNDVEQSFSRVDLLTNREREVLHLAARGLTNTALGDRLSISPRTAETHRTNLMRKLGLQSQTDLIRFAIEHGILPR